MSHPQKPSGLVRCAAVALLTIVTACASSGGMGKLTYAAAADPAPMLQPGDHVRIRVWRDTELSGDFRIAADSTITHPLYQAVKVAGVPVKEAEQRIRQFLTTYESNPQVSIEPLFSVAVGGEVRQPDLYPLPRQTTIAQAIAQAGGPTENGRLDKVRLIRDGKEVTMNLTSADAQWSHIPVRSGDQIIVQRKRNILRELVGPLASVVAAGASIIYASKR